MHYQKHTEETKKLISESRKGKTIGVNHPMYGKHHTKESNEKNRIAHLGKRASLETRMKISLALKGKYPKNVVAGWNKGLKNWWHVSTEFKKGQTSEEKNVNWKDGVSMLRKTERQLVMTTAEYKNWRRLIFERDDYTCQICGERGKKLRANHIKRYVDYPELRTDNDNGITICKACDLRWVFNHEKDWESYFYFNLETRGVYAEKGGEQKLQ